MTTTDTTSAVFEAARAGDLATLDRLLTEDPLLAADRDPEGISLLLNAYYHGRRDAVARILAAGPALDVFEAATVGDTRRLRELLEADAQIVHAWSVDGYQPLMLASFFGRPEAARLLLEHGASVSEASRNQMTVMPLHSAAAGRHAAVVRLLIEHGADVNARSHGGFVPLHSAAQNGDDETADLLLAAGADRSAATAANLTPADIADAAGHADLAARFREPAPQG